MRIFLSNSTTQHMVFFYRDPVSNLLHNVEIGSGRQNTIGTNAWGTEHIEKVVKQLERFGGHDAAEVHGKIERFHGLLYRIDGQIESKEIATGHDQVKKMQNDRSVEQATLAVLATDRSVNKERGRRVAKRTEVEVQQLPQPGKRATGDEAHFVVAVDPAEGGNKLVTHAVA